MKTEYRKRGCSEETVKENKKAKLGELCKIVGKRINRNQAK
jgi:hypothetical protein